MKLDKAIKKEQKRFEKEFKGDLRTITHRDSYRNPAFLESDVKNFLKASNKRIAKAVLEASKLEKLSDKWDNLSFRSGYYMAVQDQHKKIKELLKEI